MPFAFSESKSTAGRKGQSIRYMISSSIEEAFNCHDIPFEHDKGVPLDFNYWINHSNIVDQEISLLILAAIRGEKVEFLGSAHQVKHDMLLDDVLVLTTIHGLDPLHLSNHLHELPFLRECSSVPISHSRSIFAVESANILRRSNNPMRQWSYSDVECASSLLLWMDEPPLSKSHLQNISNASQLFTDYFVTLKV